ncbi:uncharacterized protein BYT42DRAFT_475672, partial [Radiomyces spectabilis]|uniref:uncharacterized protein n=1 Tax=Radiomyces spectabilis TaxID=64574 RepID=UPI00221FE2A6
ALYTHESNDSLVLNFEQGDYLDVNKKLPTGWWQGSCNGTAGWFPRNYVAVVDRASTPEYEQTKDLTDLIEDQLFGECLTSAQPTSPLPKHWTLQTTKDGKRHYYYNRFTGEMRPTLPDAEDANINLFDDY